jgi:hypothetical protein
MQEASNSVKLMVERQMNDLRKAVDAKEQALLADLQDTRMERLQDAER